MGQEKKKRQLPGSGLLILDIGEGAEKANQTSQRTRYTEIKAGHPSLLAGCAVCCARSGPRSPLPYRHKQSRNELLGSRDRGLRLPSHHHDTLGPKSC